ncbi:signal peptide peptidase SppA [Lentimicrobium sp.]|jgi:protease-4|uniref:signal peptide peptidase SppA n=1 Tax=Lentimicrobium sp. TaxID=2034841 RepID=UPI002BD4D555|nr:signal peptide peptidase SppA [Lentimicrobium sp.]MCO5262514.1 signal peptide peptidase SppA [Lentimicrobium sp.]HPJ62658.1 signal peptide peptidase SppA [Lentimicrobium sp.]HPR26098.1 signal peptide peptidase SppA [Lentimicrobium sp.]HRW68452.1 signal peptide peptidase SppA [Lentimicrobium sp.]
MKQFFKFMLASMAGFFLTMIVLFFFFAILVASLMTFTKKDEVVIKPKTVLHLTLNEAIPERSMASPFSFSETKLFNTSDVPGLLETTDLLKRASEDENISGILLDLSNIESGMATMEEIRNALLKFKESGKFVIAYGEVYSQKAYYMATTADIICLNPEGALDFRGMAGELVFIKGLLSKLDINPQIIRHGKYKSAIEPLISDRMSEANKEQTLAYMNSLWMHISDGISKTRNIDPAELQIIADSLKIQTPEDALNYHFVDQVIYKDQLIELLKEKLEIGENDKIEMMKLERYKDAPAKTFKKRAKEKIAVIYAVGSIGDGEGNDESIGSERISKAIRKARTDSTVKAIVFRVNSPGGSALASDVILREIKLARDEKPVVVSMGDYAASGGYYIACAADTILANPTTLTGSIGVFGVIPDFSKFFSNKLGVTFDVVKTNDHADYISVTRPLTPYEEKVITNDVERIYKVFVNHVSEGRSMPEALVDSLGQGRVWSGTDGVKTGLVDLTGGLQDAIDIAATMAKLEDYRITSLPEQKDPFTQIMEELTGNPSESRLKKELGQLYPYMKELQSLSGMKGVQARLPFILNIQ